jgi:hypothetical protein
MYVTQVNKARTLQICYKMNIKVIKIAKSFETGSTISFIIKMLDSEGYNITKELQFWEGNFHE